VTGITLNRLAAREIEAVIDRVIGNQDLSANFRQDIMERTDGVPLFIEEMTKAILELGPTGTERALAKVPYKPGSSRRPARLADGAA
jgi:hypothetical protein